MENDLEIMQKTVNNPKWWYACEEHRDGSREEYGIEPLIGRCDVCGRKAKYCGPKPNTTRKRQ